MKTNTAPPINRLQPDPELVVFDFAGAYAEKPEDALAHLELLARDRHSCLGRIALLRTANGTAGQPFPGDTPPSANSEFAAEIDMIAEGRLFDEFLAGRLSEEAIARLHRITCDVDALWAAHVRCGGALPENGSTAAD